MSSSPSRFAPGAPALPIPPWWNPIPALASPKESVSVPVRPPRWMNWIVSATDTSWMLPERLMGLLPAHECDQALQGLELAIGDGVDAGSKQRRRGVSREQIEQIPILGPEHRLVVEQLEDHQGSHRAALNGQGDASERLGAFDGADPERPVGQRRVHRGITPRVDAVL